MLGRVAWELYLSKAGTDWETAKKRGGKEKRETEKRKKKKKKKEKPSVLSGKDNTHFRPFISCLFATNSGVYLFCISWRKLRLKAKKNNNKKHKKQKNTLGAGEIHLDYTLLSSVIEIRQSEMFHQFSTAECLTPKFERMYYY